MKTGNRTLAIAYLRLSREEAQEGESGSIKNQRSIINDYCRQHSIELVSEFSDDGWSGGNFERPGFRELLKQLESGGANTVITKDLSRLGRDMRESSYYAEQFFPEHGIRYIAISDGFDTDKDNIMAPFQFAMNEVYLRDGSRKVRDVLKNKRENGLYCACPPYGYRKDGRNRNQLVPDEMTAPIVKRIFERAADGESSRRIALGLNEDGVIPPLKYRVLYRDSFSEEGAARASEHWNYTTVKRILKNRVYLGHTLLGRSRKVSVKSKMKVALPKSDWAVTEDTHEPLVDEGLFELANENLGRGSRSYAEFEQVRRSIFAGIAVCARCGSALCSCGTVYKGEREKYWYLSCTHKRSDIAAPCEGVRIRYADLCELVKRELNTLLKLDDSEISELVRELTERSLGDESRSRARLQREKAANRLSVIDRMITKLYTDNAEGLLPDERLRTMVAELEREAEGLRRLTAEPETPDPAAMIKENYARFFAAARSFTQIEQLDRETLRTFIDRIEVGPKLLPEGVKQISHRNMPFRQQIRIFYRFIGEIDGDPIRELGQPGNGELSAANSREA